jgi:hypothetical protein
MDSGEGRVEGQERSREGEGTIPPTNAGGAAGRGVGVEIVGGREMAPVEKEGERAAAETIEEEVR